MKQYENPCHHEYVPLGFEKISTDETKVEVIACVIDENSVRIIAICICVVEVAEIIRTRRTFCHCDVCSGVPFQ